MSMTNKLSLAKRRSGLTSAALSRRSGVPLSTVKTRLYTGLKKLRVTLESEER